MKVREIVLLPLMAALLLGFQVVMAVLPNIEVVTLLVMIYTLVFREKVLWILAIFVTMEGMIYGFGLWWIGYLYVWPILAGATWLLRRMESVWGWSLFSAAFGLLFGALFSLSYLVTGGIYAALAFWVAGIPFDIIHCVANFALTRCLFQPCRRVLTQLTARSA